MDIIYKERLCFWLANWAYSIVNHNDIKQILFQRYNDLKGDIKNHARQLLQ